MAPAKFVGHNAQPFAILLETAHHHTVVLHVAGDDDGVRIDTEIEQTTDHDVIAFVSQVAETVGPDGRFLHLGPTAFHMGLADMPARGKGRQTPLMS